MLRRFNLVILILFVFPVQLGNTFDEQSWNDNFEYINSVEWEFQSYGRNFWGIYYSLQPRMSFIDGILQASNSSSFFDVDMALTDSYLAYGTWEFDWNVPNGNKNYYYDSISFILSDMTGKYNLTGITGNMMSFAGYSMFLVSQKIDGLSWSPGVKLFRWNEKSEGPLNYELGSSKFLESNLESYHFKISRDLSGEFLVYVENNLLIEAQDNNVTISEKFSFASFIGNSGIDNVSVTKFSTSAALLDLGSIGTVFIMILAVLVLFTSYKKKHT